MMQAIFRRCLILLALCPIQSHADCRLNLRFGNESAALSGAGQVLMRQIAAAYPGSALQISGSAALAGDPAGSAGLAAARAEAVARYAAGLGMDRGAVAVQSTGTPVTPQPVVTLLVSPCDAAELGQTTVQVPSVAARASRAGARGGLGTGMGGALLALALVGLLAGGAETGTTTTGTTTIGTTTSGSH